MLLGLLPGLIVFLLYVAVVVALIIGLGGIVEWISPFADGWSEPWRTLVRVAIGAALLGLLVLLIVYTFTAVTMVVGQPFFEAISREVERPLGGVDGEVDVSFWRAAVRGVGEAAWMLIVTALIGIGLFLLGFVPVVGTLAAAVLGAIVGGWFLTLELTTVPFERRGLRLRDRRRVLGARRASALGFGIVVFLLFLLPGGAVVTMPAAVAGATVLSRRALGQPIDAGSS